MLDHKDGWNPEAFRGRYSEVLERYDYIIGDWGYSQLRLKGFYRDNHPKVTRDTAISGMVDYLNEYCNFGCAYFVLHKLKEVPQEGTYRDILIKEIPEPSEEEVSEDPSETNEGVASDQEHSSKEGSVKQGMNHLSVAKEAHAKEHTAKDRPVREHQSRNHRGKDSQGKKSKKEFQGRPQHGQSHKPQESQKPQNKQNIQNIQSTQNSEV